MRRRVRQNPHNCFATHVTGEFASPNPCMMQVMHTTNDITLRRSGRDKALCVRIQTESGLAKRPKKRKGRPSPAMRGSGRFVHERCPWSSRLHTRGRTMTIIPHLEGRVFSPLDIQAMSTALEDVCKILNLADEAKSDRELLAKKIIALARQGECNAALPRDSMLREMAYSGRE